MNNYKGKVLVIILLISTSIIFSQKKSNNIYFYIESGNFINTGNSYSAFFNLSNKEEAFLYDVFNFEIFNQEPFENRGILELGKIFKSENYYYPKAFFKDINNCNVNLELSLLNENNNLFLVTRIPNSNNKFMYWKVTYRGTYKSNSIYTQMGRGPFKK